MLTVRDAQLEVLGRDLESRLTDATIAHLNVTFPDACAELGREGIQHYIDVARARAARYHLESWSALIEFLHVMFVLGIDFDEDPDLPWVQGTLASTELGDARTSHLLQLALAQVSDAPDDVEVT